MTGKEYALVYGLTQELLGIRDRLTPIVTGEITRGKCLPGTLSPGKRKITMKDAVEIARHLQAHIDRIEAEFEKNIEPYTR